MTPPSPNNDSLGHSPTQGQQGQPAAHYQAQGQQNQFAQQPEKKQKNTLGLIALIVAIIGVIFSCIKGALIIGWILLPIAFILGIVSLFMKNKPKGQGIAAIVISIVGTVIAAIVFLFVVGDAVDEAFGGDTTITSSDGSSSADPDGPGSTRENPLPVGSTVEDNDWAVTINSVNLNANDVIASENEFNDPPADGNVYVLANATIKYKGTNPSGEAPSALINYVTADGNTVNSFDSIAVYPESIDFLSPLYEGAEVTGNVLLEVPADTADQGVLKVSPSMFNDGKFVNVK